MKINIDIKSLIVGLALGLVITLTIAATQKSYESGTGRYKMLMNDKKVYILDSVTGRPWCVDTSRGATTTNLSAFWKSKLTIK